MLLGLKYLVFVWRETSRDFSWFCGSDIDQWWLSISFYFLYFFFVFLLFFLDIVSDFFFHHVLLNNDKNAPKTSWILFFFFWVLVPWEFSEVVVVLLREGFHGIRLVHTTSEYWSFHIHSIREWNVHDSTVKQQQGNMHGVLNID